MPAPAVYAAQAPVAEYLAPAPSVFQAPTPEVEYISLVPLVHTAPAPVVESTPASGRKGSLRQSFVDKTCIFENDMSGVEVGKALLKLSPNGLRDMVSTLPPGAIDQFMSYQPGIKTIHEIQSSSSSSSSAEGNCPVEVCG